jgi:hypothetical protein
LQVPKEIQNTSKYWHKFKNKTWNTGEKKCHDKIQNLLKNWKLENNPKIMGKYVIKITKNQEWQKWQILKKLQKNKNLKVPHIQHLHGVKYYTQI